MRLTLVCSIVYNIGLFPSDSRLTRSASVAESASVRTVRSRWKPNENQKRILHSIFMSGVRNPPVDQVHRIAAELRRHGAVEGKNVYYWFHNAARKEKLQRQRSAPCKLPYDHFVVVVYIAF